MSFHDSSTRLHRLLALFARPFLVGLILFLTYSLTRPPYLSLIHGTDGGELTVAASTFGVAHPPGYGLYTLVAGFAIHTPPGDDAVQKIQTFSALIAISVSLLVGAVAASQFTDPRYRRQAFTLAALLCGWSRPVWEHALMIEVYLFLALLLAGLCWMIHTRQSTAKTFVMGHVFALALTHHLTALLWLPGMLILLWRRVSVRHTHVLILGFVSGVWPWLYLCARAGQAPQANWGGIERGVDAFSAHITAQDYRVFLQPFSLDAVLQGILQWIKTVPNQITPFGAVLLIVGIIITARHRQRRVWLMASGAWIVCVAGFTGVYRASETQAAYTLVLIIPIVITTSTGLMNFMISWSWMLREIMIWCLLLMIFVSHAQIINQRGDTSGLDFLAQVDQYAPAHAIVFVERDGETFLLWAAQHDGWRPDVTIVNGTLLHQEWYAKSLITLTPDLPLSGASQAERLQSLYTTTRPLIAPRLINPPPAMRAIPLGQGWYCLVRSQDGCPLSRI